MTWETWDAASSVLNIRNPNKKTLYITSVEKTHGAECGFVVLVFDGLRFLNDITEQEHPEPYRHRPGLSVFGWHSHALSTLTSQLPPS